MLFGSVPTPPKKPRSWTSTQSARHSTTRAITVARSSHVRAALFPAAVPAGPVQPIAPLSRPAPSTASAITANRFTATACAAASDAKLATERASTEGCDTDAMDEIMLPRLPCRVPCQKPRPGHAWSTATPARNAPIAARTARPACGARQYRSGSAISTPAAQ
jgi:hypothetical protein